MLSPWYRRLMTVDLEMQADPGSETAASADVAEADAPAPTLG